MARKSKIPARVTVQNPDPATIRAFFVAPFIRELRASGVPEHVYLRRHGFSTVSAGHLYERVPLRQFVALAEDMAARMGRPFLALELAGHFSLAELGPFYAMFTLAANVRTALERLARFQSAWQTRTRLEIVRNRESTICRYCIEDPSIWPRVQDAEFALGSICAVIRELTHSRWRPSSVEFEHGIAGRHDQLTRYFRAPVTGSRLHNQLLIANSDLDRPPRRRMGAEEQALQAVLEQHLLELMDARDDSGESFSEFVGRWVGRNLGVGSTDIESIAHELNLSARGVRRRLDHEGTTFREILQCERQKKFTAMFKTGRVPLSSIAAQLGYSDTAVLSRAFKAWTGLSPRQSRKKGAT